MKTRYKISIMAVVVIIIGIFVLLPPSISPILCDDKILNLDDCGDYLEEKYSTLSPVKHFREIYPDTQGLGFASTMFKAISVSATSSMEAKKVADLEISLEDSIVTYRCYDLNLDDGNHIIVSITNPTLDDMDENYCLGERI